VVIEHAFQVKRWQSKVMVGDWPGSSHKLATLDRLVDEEPVVPLAVVANHIALHAACPAHLLILANAVRCRSVTRLKIKADEKRKECDVCCRVPSALHLQGQSPPHSARCW
jgi:hypothetical protein